MPDPVFWRTIPDFGRFLQKLSLTAEYARMHFEAEGGYGLGLVAVMLEDLQIEGFALEERMERREEASYVL